MSRKHLPRTAVEGGRADRSEAERLPSTTTESRWVRLTSHERFTASELDAVTYRPRPKVYRDVGNGLAPAGREVRRRRPEGRSALAARFDTQ